MELIITALCVGILGIGLVCAALTGVALNWWHEIKELRFHLDRWDKHCSAAWDTAEEYKEQFYRKTVQYEDATGLVTALTRKHQRATMLITKLTKRLAKADARIVSLKALNHTIVREDPVGTTARVTGAALAMIGSGTVVKKFHPVPQAAPDGADKPVPEHEVYTAEVCENPKQPAHGQHQRFGADNDNTGCPICSNGPTDCGDVDCDGWNNCVPSMAAALTPADLAVPAPEGPAPVAMVSEVDPASFHTTSNVILTN